MRPGCGGRHPACGTPRPSKQMAKKPKDDSPAPPWLLEDLKKSRGPARQKKPTKGHKPAPDLPEVVHQPDQLIGRDLDAPSVSAPEVVVNADRGAIRKAWGRYKSDSMATAIIAFHRAGVPEESIQAMVGITNTQYHNWIAADPEFARDVLAARAVWEHAMMNKIAEIAESKYDWKGFAYLLERMNPNRWGPNATAASTVEAPQEGSVPVNLDPVHTTKRLEELVMKAKAAIVAAGEDPESVGPIAIDTSSDDQ